MEQCVHIAEDTAIVGDGCKDNRGGTERVCNDVGRMGLGNVKDGNMADAAVGKLSGKDIGSFFRMTVNRSVGDRYRFLFRRIGAPFEVFIDEPWEIFSPDHAVERADHPDLEPGSLL